MASLQQFRNTKEMALSYFIGGDNSICNEDEGYARKHGQTLNLRITI